MDSRNRISDQCVSYGWELVFESGKPVLWFARYAGEESHHDPVRVVKIEVPADRESPAMKHVFIFDRSGRSIGDMSISVRNQNIELATVGEVDADGWRAAVDEYWRGYV